MAETGTPTNLPEPPSPPARGKDEVALELMKFIAVQTGYGRAASHSSAGFSGKPSTRSAEEYAESLLELFERCRGVVAKSSGEK
jgi:hypothetical protein